MNKYEARRRKKQRRKHRERRSRAIERRWLRWCRQWDDGPPYNVDDKE